MKMTQPIEKETDEIIISSPTPCDEVDSSHHLACETGSKLQINEEDLVFRTQREKVITEGVKSSISAAKALTIQSAKMSDLQ